MTVESGDDSRTKVFKKRKNEWYHHEIEDKKIKLEKNCCSWGSGGMSTNSEENRLEFFDVCSNCLRIIGNLENNIDISTSQTVPQDPLPTTGLENKIELKNDTEIDQKTTLGDTQEDVVVAKKLLRKQGKRVWAKKANGLFGWKTEKRILPASRPAQVKWGKTGKIKPILAESETGLGLDDFQADKDNVPGISILRK